MDNPQTKNMYAYVENNPLAYTDPSGLDAILQINYNPVAVGNHSYVSVHEVPIISSMSELNSLTIGAPIPVFRAGSSNEVSNPISAAGTDILGFDSYASNQFGAINAIGGNKAWKAENFGAEDVASQQIYISGIPEKQVVQQLETYTTNINFAKIPYLPTEENSNSFAHKAPTVFGLPRAVPPNGVTAYGYDRELDVQICR